MSWNNDSLRKSAKERNGIAPKQKMKNSITAHAKDNEIYGLQRVANSYSLSISYRELKL